MVSCFFQLYLGKWSNLINIFQICWNHHLVSTLNPLFSEDYRIFVECPSIFLKQKPICVQMKHSSPIRRIYEVGWTLECVYQQWYTLDGRNPANQLIWYVNILLYIGFYTSWCRISVMNSTTIIWRSLYSDHFNSGSQAKSSRLVMG